MSYNRLQKGDMNRLVTTPGVTRYAGVAQPPVTRAAPPKKAAEPALVDGKLHMEPFKLYGRIRRTDVKTGLVEAFFPYSLLPTLPGGFKLTPEVLRNEGANYQQRNAISRVAAEQVWLGGRAAAVEYEPTGVVVRAMVPEKRDRELAQSGGYSSICIVGRVTRVSGQSVAAFDWLETGLAITESGAADMGLSLYRAEGVAQKGAGVVTVDPTAGTVPSIAKTAKSTLQLQAEYRRLIDKAENEVDPGKRRGYAEALNAIKQQLAARGEPVE